MGEIAILEPQKAEWILAKKSTERHLAGNVLERQFHVNDMGAPEDFASSWLGQAAQEKIHSEVGRLHKNEHLDEKALMPCWHRQIMRAVAPVTNPAMLPCAMEWLLDCTVTTLGQLLLQLGGIMDLLVVR